MGVGRRKEEWKEWWASGKIGDREEGREKTREGRKLKEEEGKRGGG